MTESALEVFNEKIQCAGGCWSHDYAVLVYIRVMNKFHLVTDSTVGRELADNVPRLSFGMTPNVFSRQHCPIPIQGGFNLNQLFVPPSMRKMGAGTKLMEGMIEISQFYNQTLYLIPAYNMLMEPCMNQEALIKWYRKLGFKLIPVSSGGKGHYMRRIPRARLFQERDRVIGRPNMRFE